MGRKVGDNSPSLSAGYIIVSFISAATNSPGGTRKGSILSLWPQTSGERYENSLPAPQRSPQFGILENTTDRILTLAPSTRGAVAGLVGIRVGVVSGVINLESSGVEASDWRLRHDQAYHEA